MRTMRAHTRRITSTARRYARIRRVALRARRPIAHVHVGIAAPSQSAILPPSSPKDFFAIRVHERRHERDQTDLSIASLLRAITRTGINIVSIAGDRATTIADVTSRTMHSRDVIAIVDGASRGVPRP